ncbi:hypothetical protein [Hahella sp. HN01]|uniref:hypothetical protein n=1 Tax=unclassified Hahella TaxID=2624107 RepID=UPI001C1EE46A|nr:hypothetical protein [Hahella sp. HN01]MBU6952789.1 hypothetical protein [Hahella sp. HN01]
MLRLITIVFALIYPLLQAQAVEAEVAIIVNPKANLDLSNEDIQKLFMAKQAFLPNGEKATIVSIDSSSALFEEFCAKVVNKGSRQFLSYWSRLIFTGKAAPMITAASNQDIKELVAKNLNYIGFISAADLDETVKAVKTY